MAFSFEELSRKRDEAISERVRVLNEKIQSELIWHDFSFGEYGFIFRPDTHDDVIAAVADSWSKKDWYALIEEGPYYSTCSDPKTNAGYSKSCGTGGYPLLGTHKLTLLPGLPTQNDATISATAQLNGFDMSIEQFVAPLNFSPVQMALLKGIYSGKLRNEDVVLSFEEMAALISKTGNNLVGGIPGDTLWSILNACNYPYVKEAIWTMGRRSGATNLCVAIAAYELYQLLADPNPQARYGMTAGNKITVFMSSMSPVNAISPTGQYIDTIYKLLHHSGLHYEYKRAAIEDGVVLTFKTMYDMMSGNEGSVQFFLSKDTSNLFGYDTKAIILNDLHRFTTTPIYMNLKSSLASFGNDGLMVMTGMREETDLDKLSVWDAFYQHMQGAGAFWAQIPSAAANPILEYNHLNTEQLNDPCGFDVRWKAKLSSERYTAEQLAKIGTAYGVKLI